MTIRPIRELCEDLEAAVSKNLRGGKKNKFVIGGLQWYYLSQDDRMDFEDFVVDLARELGPAWIVRVTHEKPPRERLFRMVVSWFPRNANKGEKE